MYCIVLYCIIQGYKGFHKYNNGKKGQLDKKGHKHTYDEHEGHEKKKHEEGGHYDEHHHGEKGEKSAEFKDEGKHQKGYSTKGEHNIFKKVCCRHILKNLLEVNNKADT